jgi:hypothetical protein
MKARRMKEIIILGLLLLSPAVFGELTKEDVRTIVKEEVTASETRMREFIDLKLQATNTEIKATNIKIEELDKRLSTKIEELDKRLGNIFAMTMALVGLIAAAIAVPQIIIAFKEKGQSKLEAQIEQGQSRLEAQIEQLRQKIELLEQSRILRS